MAIVPAGSTGQRAHQEPGKPINAMNGLRPVAAPPIDTAPRVAPTPAVRPQKKRARADVPKSRKKVKSRVTLKAPQADRRGTTERTEVSEVVS